MRILYLCHRIPYPPDKGDKIRAFHQLLAIASRHDVDLFTLADDPGDLAHRAVLLRFCRNVTVAAVNPFASRIRAIPYLLTRKPLTLPYFQSVNLQRQVNEALAKKTYDRIFVYCSAMAQYVDSLRDIPILIDMVDVDSDKWAQYARATPFPLSIIYLREASCLRQVERAVCEKASCVFVTTHREAALLRLVLGSPNVHVIPNGVDTEYFSVSAAAPEPPPTIVFTGDMGYFPNEDAVSSFTRKVFPLVRQSVPAARFVIVGRNPSRAVRRLRNVPGVHVTGFVPDVRTHLVNATVAVAPFSIAAGIQNKILEAMACGVPVVGTSRAVQGLIPAVAQLVDVGDTPQELAERIVVLLSDADLARRRGLESRERVAGAYNWRAAMSDMLEFIVSPVIH